MVLLITLHWSCLFNDHFDYLWGGWLLFLVFDGLLASFTFFCNFTDSLIYLLTLQALYCTFFHGNCVPVVFLGLRLHAINVPNLEATTWSASLVIYELFHEIVINIQKRNANTLLKFICEQIDQKWNKIWNRRSMQFWLIGVSDNPMIKIANNPNLIIIVIPQFNILKLLFSFQNIIWINLCFIRKNEWLSCFEGE